MGHSTPAVSIAATATLVVALVGCSGTADDAAIGSCAADRIEQDLDVADHLAAANPTVAECTGDWAVIRWDAPGDSQRIVRRVDSTWVDYVRFPHDRCWSTAVEDSVPDSLRPYFIDC